LKWHIICLFVIGWSLVYPMTRDYAAGHTPLPVAAVYQAAPGCDGPQSAWSWEAAWQATIWGYGACPGRVTLCRWWLQRARGSTTPRQQRARLSRPTPRAKRARAAGPTTREPAAVARTDPPPGPPAAAGPATRVPLRLVVRPGVILTKRGLRLRPLIARLGADVSAYRVLWADRARWPAIIAPVLRQPCPLCAGSQGFRRIGSAQRSLIPPGSKEPVWFRVQKVECRDCGARTRILPTFCLPYKRHHAQTIQNALENCWRRNNSYRDTMGILNQSRPAEGQYVGHTLPYEWTIWLGGLTIHLPQFLVWLGLQLPRQGVLDEYFLTQANGTAQHRIFAVTVQDPASTAIWNIVRVDRNDTAAFKQTLQQLQQVGVQLRAITTDGWPAILKAVREELAGAIHLLCYFHAKKNVFETLEEYRRAKKLGAEAPELEHWRQAFFAVLDAPNAKLYRARLRQLTKQVAAEPLLLARCRSLQKKSHYNTWRLRSPLLAATTSLVELSFKFLTRKVESMYSFRQSQCDAAQKSLTVWALVRDFVPYLPGAKHAGQSPAELAGVDLAGLPWLQYINLKLSAVA